MSSRPRRARAGHDDAGLGLVEVIVAMFVFALISLSMLTSITKSLTLSRDNRGRVVAASLAASQLDAVRQQAQDLDNYNLLTTTTLPAQTIDGVRYTVYVSVDPVFADGNGNACSGGNNTREVYKKVSVRVVFPTEAHAQPVRADTIVRTPSVSAGSSAGAIGASVIDRNGQPVEGVTVTVGASNAQTDEGGCAYLPGVSAGNYSVVVSRTGYVSVTGATSVTRTVGVTSGVISSPQFQLDAASTLQTRVAVLAANGSELTGYGFPRTASTVGVVPYLENPDTTSPTRTTLTGTATSTASTWSVAAFPFSNGYVGHLGTCGTQVPVIANPGTSTPVSLGLAPLGLAVTQAPGYPAVPIVNRTIQAVSTVAGCSETYTSQATTAADGTLKLALPYGNWNLSVVNGSLTAPAVAPVPVSLVAGAVPGPITLTVNK